MADEDLEQEEDRKTEITSPEIMIEWDRIQSPSSATDPFNGGLSMVDKSLDHPKIVFPPVNHEGLDHVFSDSASPYADVKEIDIERVSLPPPTPLPTPRPMMPTVGDATGGWWDAGLEMLRFKVAGIVSTFRKFAAARGFQMSFQSRFGFVAPLAGSMMVLLLYLRFRRRQRTERESIAELIRVVREKDEKMNQLLHQVARMNELLLALASHPGSRAASVSKSN